MRISFALGSAWLRTGLGSADVGPKTPLQLVLAALRTPNSPPIFSTFPRNGLAAGEDGSSTLGISKSLVFSLSEDNSNI